MSGPDSQSSGEPFLPLIRPTITFDDVERDLRAVFASGTLTRGPYLERFESAFAERVGAAHAVAVTSATTALHLTLIAAGIGHGDEVLASDFSFPATGNAIIQSGATPVLIDCLPGRFELDVDQAAAKITARTKAIVHVDPFGRPADLEAVAQLCSEHGLFALEDAACAIGAVFAGKPVGGWPGATAFSFHPRKLLTTGEGGAITTQDRALAERLRLLRSHGAAASPSGVSFVEHGFNYRMSEVQAVMGLAQLARLDASLADRRATAEIYERLLTDSDVTLAPVDERAAINYQSFVVWLPDDCSRQIVQDEMRAAGIETTLGTYAMHSHPAFAKSTGLQAGDLPHSFAAQERTLTLPLVPGMERRQIERVCTALDRAIACSRQPVSG